MGFDEMLLWFCEMPVGSENEHRNQENGNR